MKREIKILLRIFILLFAFNLLFFTKSNAETERGPEYEWTYTVEDGKAVDVYISNGIIANEITVPSTLGGYPVARIGKQNETYKNFINNQSSTRLTRIYLPSSLEEIGDYAFYNMNYLQQVGLGTDITKLPNITKIGNYAFGYCRGLTNITLPDSLEEISNNAFYVCNNLASVTLSVNLKSIGNYAFSNCKKIASINLPESLTSIGDYVFQNCSSITEIEVPSTLENLGNYAFSGTGLSSVPENLPGNIISKGLFANCSSISGTLLIQEGIAEIGDNAFQGCSNMTGIEIPNTVEKIGDYAFSGTGLSSIPENLRKYYTKQIIL